MNKEQRTENREDFTTNLYLRYAHERRTNLLFRVDDLASRFLR